MPLHKSRFLNSAYEVSATLTEKGLELHQKDDIRVLQKISVVDQLFGEKPNEEQIKILFIDVETTGNDDNDEVIQLAIVPVLVNKESRTPARVVNDEIYVGMRDSDQPINPRAAMVHGLTKEDIKSKQLDLGKIKRLLSGSNVAVSFNALFDRRMVEKIIPEFAESYWLCLMRDVDWASEGFLRQNQEYLCQSYGFYYEAHDALGDCIGGIALLAQELPHSKKFPLEIMIEKLKEQHYLIAAEGDTYDQIQILKQRGYVAYYLKDKFQFWWKATPDAHEEAQWLRNNIRNLQRDIRIWKLEKKLKHSAQIETVFKERCSKRI